MATTPQPRQPAGVPEGGQWTAGTQPESDVKLGESTNLDDAPRDPNVPRIWLKKMPKRNVPEPGTFDYEHLGREGLRRRPTKKDIRVAEEVMKDLQYFRDKPSDIYGDDFKEEIYRKLIEYLDKDHKARFYTEGSTAYRDLPRYAMWSPAARQMYDGGSSNGQVKGLRDEHVVPIKTQVADIFQQIDHSPDFTAERMAELISRYPRAVVTEDEASKIDFVVSRDSMPGYGYMFSDKGMWARYINEAWNRPIPLKKIRKREY